MTMKIKLLTTTVLPVLLCAVACVRFCRDLSAPWRILAILLTLFVVLISGVFAYSDRSSRLLTYLSAAAIPLLFLSRLLLSGFKETDTVSFTMDDGYIYGNYVLSAARGHFFQYNVGEYSGGITSFLWFLLQVPIAKVLLRFFTASQAMYAAAFCVSACCVVATGLLLVHFSTRLYRSRMVALVTLILIVSSFQFVWAALSGIENPLTTLVVLLGVYLAYRIDEGASDGMPSPAWTFYCFAGVCFVAYAARPDLLPLFGGILLFLGIRLLSGTREGITWVRWLVSTSALLTGALLVCALYKAMTGSPFPNSFYVKVSPGFGIRQTAVGLKLVLCQLSGVEIAAYAAFIFVLVRRFVSGEEQRRWLLPALAVGLYILGKAASLPTLGQEHRYISMMLPVVMLFGIGELVSYVFDAISENAGADASRYSLLPFAGASVWVAVLLAFVSGSVNNYLGYVKVRRQGDIAIGKWIAANTPKDTVVASEPIGSIHLYSNRRTVDVVGLTSNAYLGRYPNWPRVMEQLRRDRPDYLVYYPDWFQLNGFKDSDKYFTPVLTVNITTSSSNPPKEIGSTPIVLYHYNKE